MTDSRATEQRGLDDARQGLNNPPHDPEERQAYDAGRNVHLEEERRRVYADQVAEGATSLGASVASPPSAARTDGSGRIVWTSNIYEVFLAFAYVAIIALFTGVVYGAVTLPFTLFRVTPPSLLAIVAIVVFIGGFYAPVYLQQAREFFRVMVPPITTGAVSLASAVSVISGGISAGGALNWLIATSATAVLTFGLCRLIYNWIERVKPL